MHLRSSAHLPGTGGRLIEAAAEEVLAKKPAGTGDHFWLKVQKDGLGSQQAREAIARSVNLPVELVSDAGFPFPSSRLSMRGRCVVRVRMARCTSLS